jgi:maltooligosyltrehalose trehalohydrolase
VSWPPRFGAVAGHRGVHFRVWAPAASRVSLTIESSAASTPTLPLEHEADGCWSVETPEAAPGHRYGFHMNDGPLWPDPASRFQPDGVHGLSEIVDPHAFAWSDAGWQGPESHRLVFYELHVGTFTDAGTFDGVTARLPYLRDLGITAIELMPVAAFPGRWNWGYDGAALFAPSERYGRPDDLRRLVDHAHASGLAVFLDVVYNHLGPDGAYLAAFSDRVLSRRHRTPWSTGLNFDDEGSAVVRQFFIENALHWLIEYHLDGLRLDATHAIADDSPTPFLAELASAVRTNIDGRRVHLIAEDARNVNTIARPTTEGGWGLDGVWADDLHHQIRRHVAGDREGYYADYEGTTADIAATIRKGWFYSGEMSRYRGRPRGTDATGLPAHAFVVCLQNHDQVGNRALGERLNHQVPPDVFRAASALVLLAPETPLVFMGQEWAASTPFLFFTDHRGALGSNVSARRREEFRHFTAFSEPSRREQIPDPQDERTFFESRLRWRELDEELHRPMLAWYRAVLSLRHETSEWLTDDLNAVDAWAPDDETVAVLRRGREARALLVVVRLSGGGRVALRLTPALRLSSTGAVLGGPRLSSEHPAFAPDSAPPDITVDSDGALSIDFERAGALAWTISG